MTEAEEIDIKCQLERLMNEKIAEGNKIIELANARIAYLTHRRHWEDYAVRAYSMNGEYKGHGVGAETFCDPVDRVKPNP